LFCDYFLLFYAVLLQTPKSNCFLGQTWIYLYMHLLFSIQKRVSLLAVSTFSTSFIRLQLPMVVYKTDNDDVEYIHKTEVYLFSF